MTIWLAVIAGVVAIASFGMTIRTILVTKRQAQSDLKTIRSINSAVWQMETAAFELNVLAQRTANGADSTAIPAIESRMRYAPTRYWETPLHNSYGRFRVDSMYRSRLITQLIIARSHKAPGGTSSEPFRLDLRPAVEHAAKVGRIRVTEVEPLLEWFCDQEATTARDRSPVSRIVEWERLTVVEYLAMRTVDRTPEVIDSSDFPGGKSLFRPPIWLH